MGLLSVLLVRHDCLHDIREDTNIGKEIYNKICSSWPGNDKRISSALEVVETDIHSSAIRIVVVEGNTAYPIRYGTTEIPKWSKAEDVLTQIMKDLGYTVTKKRKRKR